MSPSLLARPITPKDATDIINLVAANVRKLRQMAGLSQEHLAHQASIDRADVSQFERQKLDITITVLARHTILVNLSKRVDAPQDAVHTFTIIRN